MEGLILIAYLLFFAFTNACLAYFLEVCFEENMILERYLPWLAKKTLGKNTSVPGIREDSQLYKNELMERAAKETFWYKPLGGCIVCFSVWLSIPVYLVSIVFFDLTYLGAWHIFLWIAYTVISNFMVRKMSN